MAPRDSRPGLVVTLLLSTATAAALVPACVDCPDTVATPEPYSLPEDITVLGELWDDYNGDRYLVGADGVVIELFGDTRVQRPVDVDLRAVVLTSELVIVAGAAGVVAAAPRGSDEWQVIDLGTTADLHGATYNTPAYGTNNPTARVLIVGDDVMFSHDPIAGTWTPVAPPEGGWGQLRAVHADWESKVLAVGRGGVIWSASSPQGPWTREDAGTDADLWTVHNGLIGGDGGLVLARDSASGTWQARPIDSSSAVIDVFPAILTAAGELFDIDYDGTISPTPKTDPVPGAHVVLPDESDAYLVLGEPGSHRQVGKVCYGYE